MTKINKSKNNQCCQEEKEPLSTVGSNVNYFNILEKQSPNLRIELLDCLANSLLGIIPRAQKHYFEKTFMVLYSL